MPDEDVAAGRAAEAVHELAREARAEMPAARLEARYGLRYRGQAFELEVTAALDAGAGELRSLFEEEHERRYGYRDRDGAIELVNVLVSATEERAGGGGAAAPGGRVERGRRTAVFGGRPHETEVLRGPALPGESCAGPAVWELPESTAVVPPGWTGTVDEHGTLVLERV
jgi:N-methylhydantoinase A